MCTPSRPRQYRLSTQLHGSDRSPQHRPLDQFVEDDNFVATTLMDQYYARSPRPWFGVPAGDLSDINAHCSQITFAGDDLGQFHLAGPDTFVYVLVPPPGRNDLSIDQSFSWDDYWKMPDDERPVGAYYTVRRWRPESNEVDILFVLHDNPGAASDWARRAQPGDPAALWGPRTSYEPPADTDWYLLVADDTGLPAIGSILEQLPAETQARVYVEVDNPDEQHELASPPDVEITWLYRNGAKPGTTSLLPDAVRRLTWPGGNPTYGAQARATP